MTCHECGSDVAEIDVFCPFCGISLEPVSLAEDQIDDSMASTIMIQPSEIEALAAAAKTPVSPISPSVKELEPEPSGVADENGEPLESAMREPAGSIKADPGPMEALADELPIDDIPRSEEHTSELQSR